MLADIQNHQRRLITVVAILVLLFLLLLGAILQSIQHVDQDRQIGHRTPAARLAYCAPQDNTHLCIVSFGQIVGGDLLINFQVPRLLYPDFTLVINRFGAQSSYKCERVKGLSIGVTCTGASQVPGEILQFKVISKVDGSLLAEGKFSIIGIALSTPEILTTGTAGTPTTPEASETPSELFPTPGSSTPASGIATPTPTSNPSYPNPTTYP